MSYLLSAAQRVALREQVRDRLSGIRDIELCLRKEDYATAERLAREYADEVELLVGGVGFGGSAEGDGPVELIAHPDVLRRVLPRLRDLAAGHAESVRPQLIEAQEMENRSRLVTEVCTAVLEGLDRAETIGR